MLNSAIIKKFVMLNCAIIKILHNVLNFVLDLSSFCVEHILPTLCIVCSQKRTNVLLRFSKHDICKNV